MHNKSTVDKSRDSGLIPLQQFFQGNSMGVGLGTILSKVNASFV
jgi:hypothetical protein